jgi:predicted ATPase/Tfp pilus assembly protein PilF
MGNCEHLIEACARLVDAVLRACPHLRILATSRELLGVPGEVARRVPPLGVPDPGEVPSPDRLAGCEAVRLFVERARLLRPGFAVTEQNAPALALLCRRLDGIPLALELAAARSGVLTVGQIAERLDERVPGAGSPAGGGRFGLLTGGGRTAAPRQQTPRALVDWSYDLLSADERTVLRRLAVFNGGFTLEAAEAVCAGGGPEAVSVLDLLGALVQKSLVSAEERRGAVRYALLETIRAYGLERLAAAAEEETLRRRHSACYLALAERAEPHLRGPDLAAWLDLLEQEHGNIRQALAWCRTAPDGIDAGLRLTGALHLFWYLRGHLAEGRAWLEGALAAAAGTQPTRARAKALFGAGFLAYWQGDREAAAARCAECLAVARESGEAESVGAALVGLGLVARDRGEYTTAQRHFEESLAVRRGLDDRWGVAMSLHYLAILAAVRGDLGAARRLFQESLAIARHDGDVVGVANRVGWLGYVAYGEGNHDASRALLAESLARFREMAGPRGIAWTLGNLGLLALATGDAAAARALCRESLGTAWRLGIRRLSATALEGLAGVAAGAAQPRRALRLAAVAAALRTESGMALAPRDRAALDGWLAADLALDALEMALWARRAKRLQGLVHHSDPLNPGCRPWSEWWISPGAGRRRRSAISRASTTSRAPRSAAIAQPTTRRLHASSTTAR